MAGCSQLRWFRLTHSQNTHFCYSHSRRFEVLAEEANSKYGDPRPSLLTFLGRGRRETVVSRLLNTKVHEAHENLTTLREWHGLAYNHPVFVAEATLEGPSIDTTHLQFCDCHQDKSFPIICGRSTNRELLQARLLVRTVFPISSVVVWFIDDYDAVAVQNTIKCWKEIGPDSQFAKPTLLLISEHESLLTACQSMCRITETFAAVHYLGMDIKTRSPLKTLRDTLLQHNQHGRQRAQDQDRLFTASHLARIHELMVGHLARDPDNAADIVRMTKPDYNSDDHRKYLQKFIELASFNGVSISNIVALIASSMAMYAWPPGSHRFSADDFYKSLFGPVMKSALKNLEVDLYATYCQELRCALAERRERIDFQDVEKPAFDLHRQEVQQQRIWRSLKSNVICLFCLMRAPQEPLICGHTLCNTCVTLLSQSNTDDYCYEIKKCVFCSRNAMFKKFLKPPTCGARILSLDGGGTRGVIILEHIMLLQTTLADSSLRFLDLFDLVVATSVGGLHALALTRGSPKDWDSQFEQVVNDTIGRADGAKAILDRCRRALHCLVEDGLYDAKSLDEVFKSVYGINQTLFGWTSNEHTPKIAVTTTSIALKPKTYLLTNYNPIYDRRTSNKGRVPLDYDYHGHSEYMESEPRIWQAARATSAAPLLFPTITFNNRTYQDGGMRNYNNPVNICEPEMKRIWGTSQKYDILISLGTGYQKEAESPPKFRSVWTNGFAPRLIQNTFTFSDNHETHLAYSGRLDSPTQKKYFRMDLELSSLPKMHDAKAMPSLREEVQKQKGGQAIREKVCVTLLLTSFYFKLDEKPVFRQGFYHCTGAIRCRHPPTTIINALRSHNPNDLVFMLHHNIGDITLGQIRGLKSEKLYTRSGDLHICKRCKLFSIPVSFSIRHMTEEICMYAKMGTQKEALSGFPHAIEWFVEQQRLDAVFGRDDHVSLASKPCPGCNPVRVKRKTSSVYSEQRVHKTCRWF